MTAPESVEAAAQPPMNNVLAQMHQERLRRHGADAHEPAPQPATPAPAPAAPEEPSPAPIDVDEPSSSGVGAGQAGTMGPEGGASAGSPSTSPLAHRELKPSEKAGGLSARKALAALTGERPPSGTRRGDPVARRISLLSDDTPMPSAPPSLPEVERPSPSSRRGAREVPLPKQNLRRSDAQKEGSGGERSARSSARRGPNTTPSASGAPGSSSSSSRRAAAPQGGVRHPPPPSHPPSASPASPSSSRTSRYATRTSNNAPPPQPRAAPPGVGGGPGGRAKDTRRSSGSKPGQEEPGRRRPKGPEKDKEREEQPVSAPGEIYKEFQAQIKAQEDEDRKVAELMAQQDRKIFGVGDKGLARAMQEEADAREMMHQTDEDLAKELEEQYRNESRANRRGNGPPAGAAGAGPGGRGRGARTRLPEVGRGGGGAPRAPARGGEARRPPVEARREAGVPQPQPFEGGESDMDALLAQQLYQDQFDD